MGVNSLPKTVIRQRRDCDLNPGPSAPEYSTLTTRLPSHPSSIAPTLIRQCVCGWYRSAGQRAVAPRVRRRGPNEAPVVQSVSVRHLALRLPRARRPVEPS